MADSIMHRLYERGKLSKLSTKQFYDTEAQTFLNGRQVNGRCPIKGCKSEKAYAEECDLGHQFNPEELIAPVSQLTGTTPELRPAPSWYFDLPQYKEFLNNLVEKWKNKVPAWCRTKLWRGAGELRNRGNEFLWIELMT